jgi:large subunit ribosomal protein L5
MAENMRVFHVTKRAEDGKWTVKEEKTDDVLHTFDTRDEATHYCEVFAEEKDALIKYHASKGKNKGRIIEVYNSRTMDPKEFANLMKKYEEENDALTDEDEGPDAVEEEPVVEEKKAPAKKAAPKAKEEAPKAAPKAKKAGNGNKKAAIVSRVQVKYENEIRAKLMEKYNYSSPMQIPALSKIVINIGVGDATQDSKKLEEAVSELTLISGQKPIITKAKKSIATFKLREGQEIGCKVDLRGLRMYDFFDKLVSIALPRVRDFRGVSKNAFDGRGNYTLGIKEQLIFPEIDYDKVAKVRGMDIVIVTTAKNDAEAYTLLELLGMPFHR